MFFGCFSLAFAVFLLLFAAVGCCLLLLPWICFGLLLFATCVAPEWCQSAPQRPQNAPKMDPKSTQIAPWSALGPPGGTKILFCNIGIDFGAQFGPQRDPKIDQKSIVCEKNAPRSALSKQCLPGALLHLNFSSFFWYFLVKKEKLILRAPHLTLQLALNDEPNTPAQLLAESTLLQKKDLLNWNWIRQQNLIT